jgi:class 3 adenylate cyclase/tetratricopeptide (TPR) repeat protein
MLTDLVGYTSLTQRDEATALRLLEEHRQIVRPLLREHSGREVKTIGDAFLVEFANALDATRCAISIQRSMHERNAKGPREKVELRIGLHVGDVVEQNGDIYGDAVNLVSRVEPMAEPGGVCVSGPVHDQVRNKIELPFAPLGTPYLKNVEFPVPLFRVQLPWMVTSLATRTPWIDRPNEHRILREALERAAKGEGSAVLLIGESGVGKTRLAEEVIREAETAGFRVLRGRAFPGELATPYAQWAEMVRGFIQGAPPPLVYKVIGTSGGEVMRLAPELAGKVGAAGPIPNPTEDSEAGRARFYGAVTQFFLDLSKEAPLILLFDDLQWADLASLRLLEFALRPLPQHRLLILGTTQPTEGEEGNSVAETLRYLRKNEMLRTVLIRQWDAVSVGVMIGKIFGEEEVSEEFRTLIHARTGGNPYFVEEVLRSLVEEGAIYRNPGGGWDRKGVREIGIPKSVREVVKQRVSRLDEPTLSTLRVAAVLGTEFASELLRDVSGVEEEPLIEQLERLVRAGLLTESKTTTPFLSFAFSDARLREVLYSEVLSLRRVRYHRKAGEALERRAGNRREEFAVELAHHFQEGHDAAKAVEYALIAADRSAKVFGFESAETHYRTALRLLEEAPEDRARGRALDGLGRVHYAWGRLEEAIPEWEAAVGLYESTGEARRAGALCRRLVDQFRFRPQLARGEPKPVEAWLERGRRALESIPPTAELSDLYDVWGIYLSEVSSLLEARAMLEKGIEVARSIGDPEAELSVRADLWFTYSVLEKEKVVPFLEEFMPLISRPGKENWQAVAIFAHNLTAMSLEILGDPGKALGWAERGIETSQRIRDRTMEAELWERKGRVQLWRGWIRESEESLQKSRELRGIGEEDYDETVDWLAGEIALARGSLDETFRLLSKLINSERATLRRRAAPALSEVHRRRHEIDQAERLLRRASEDWPVSLEEMRANDGWHRLRLRAGLVETLLEQPREAERTKEIEQLAAEAHRLAEALGNPAGLGINLHLQGMLAAWEGRSSEAVARWEEAAAQFRKADHWAGLTRSLDLLVQGYREGGHTEKADAAEGEAKRLRNEHRSEGTARSEVRTGS